MLSLRSLVPMLALGHIYFLRWPSLLRSISTRMRFFPRRVYRVRSVRLLLVVEFHRMLPTRGLAPSATEEM